MQFLHLINNTSTSNRLQWFLIKIHHNPRNWKIYCVEHRQKQLRNTYYKITPNLLFEYQCTSGKFIRLPNRIESKKIDSVARIESTLFCPNWNALATIEVPSFLSWRSSFIFTSRCKKTHQFLTNVHIVISAQAIQVSAVADEPARRMRAVVTAWRWLW